MKAPGRLAREAVLLLAGAAVLAGLAFGAQRLFFPRPAPHHARDASPQEDLPAWLDGALAPVILRQVRAENRLVEDPKVTAAVDAVLDRLSGPGGAGSIEVLVIDSSLVNAFAAPGGVVCVYTGLLKALPSADEFAAVLAHEMSHVQNRDALASLARRLGMTVLLSALGGGRGSSAAQGLLADLVSLRYGREAEDRADAFAVELLADRGIDPAAWPRALASLRDSGTANPGLLRYLDPHSPIDERIARAEKEAAAAGARAGAQPPGRATAPSLAVDWDALVRSLPSALEPPQE